VLTSGIEFSRKGARIGPKVSAQDPRCTGEASGGFDEFPRLDLSPDLNSDFVESLGYSRIADRHYDATRTQNDEVHRLSLDHFFRFPQIYHLKSLFGKLLAGFRIQLFLSDESQVAIDHLQDSKEMLDTGRQRDWRTADTLTPEELANLLKTFTIGSLTKAYEDERGRNPKRVGTLKNARTTNAGYDGNTQTSQGLGRPSFFARANFAGHA
jgi:hypothetical protein